MSIKENYIKKFWPFPSLKGIRESTDDDSTYYFFDFNNLPPIPENLPDDFAWLKPHKNYDEYVNNYLREMDLYRRKFEEEGKDFTDKLNILELEAKNLGLCLPNSFINFLSNPDINCKIESATDCYFELGNFIEKITISDNYYLLHFMSDSQYCLLWYLCFNQTGEYFILASEKVFCHGRENENSGFIGYYCASSFKEFIYRISIENRIWYKTSWYKADLEEDERDYVDFYLNQDDNKNLIRLDSISDLKKINLT